MKCTLIVYAVVSAFLLAGAGCDHAQEGNKGKPLRDINEVKEAHTAELMALPGVVGVYVGRLDDGTPCIGVMVVEKKDELVKKIPGTLEGHPVRIEETGEIKPLK